MAIFIRLSPKSIPQTTINYQSCLKHKAFTQKRSQLNYNDMNLPSPSETAASVLSRRPLLSPCFLHSLHSGTQLFQIQRFCPSPLCHSLNPLWTLGRGERCSFLQKPGCGAWGRTGNDWCLSSAIWGQLKHPHPELEQKGLVDLGQSPPCQ